MPNLLAPIGNGHRVIMRRLSEGKKVVNIIAQRALITAQQTLIALENCSEVLMKASATMFNIFLINFDSKIFVKFKDALFNRTANKPD